ncbi:uncharacterized protein LOC134276703 [Saccostrea cucullata]|uniref:uncharacterized protein LOC134276703 n=1 Tax=Saccostrea cuccullata TaxID=36930 RepID=UPI002ED18F5D
MGKQGFSIIPINRPDEITSYYDRKNPQVFVIDDPCGEFIVDEQAANVWVKYSKDIQTCLNFQQKEDQVKSKLLVSCRFFLSLTRAFRMIKIFSNSIISLENHENQLSVSEKKQILSAHVQHEIDLSHLDLKKNFDCFPYLCKIYGNAFIDSASMGAFFENPFIELVSKLDVMVRDPRSETIHEYCALVCCALAEEKLNLLINSRKATADEHLQEIFNACDTDIDSSNLRLALEKLKGKYVKKVGCSFSLIHSKLLEVIVWHFGKRWPETLILHSSTEIFQNRLRPIGRLQEDLDDKQDLSLLELDNKFLSLYAKRIEKDINQGNLRNIFKNPCLPNEQIETCLFDLLGDGNVLKEALLKTNSSLSSSNTDTYASFSKENLLEKTRITFLHCAIAYNWATFLEKLFDAENVVLYETLFAQRASTLYLAILSENLHIVQMCLKYYGTEIFSNISDFVAFGMEFDTYCIFCGANLTDSSHDLHCLVTLIPIPMLVCITGKLDILEFLIQIAVISSADLTSEFQFFNERVSPLVVASLYGHTDIVQYLLQHGASVNYQDQDGITALHEACQEGNEEVIRTLLSFGADVNLKDNDGETPISLACINDFTAIVDQLLRNGADINVSDTHGLTLIHKTISAGHIQTAQFLIENGCDINITSENGETSFSLACFHGNCCILKLLLMKEIKKEQIQDGMLKACVKGHTNIISILTDHGAKVNFQNSRGFSALHFSCAHAHPNLVTELISKGAIPNIQSDDKQTPLHCASHQLCEKCVSILLRNNATINALDHLGRSALHYALQTTDFEEFFYNEIDEIEGRIKNVFSYDLYLAKDMPKTKVKTHTFNFPFLVNVKSEKFLHSNHEVSENLEKVIDILIKNKIKINTADINNCSPLHMVCAGNFPKIVKTLIHHGSSVNARSKRGHTPLHIACISGNLFTVNLLVEKGANINARDIQGFVPFHLACFMGHTHIVTTLLKSGENVNITDKTGLTPLHITVKSGNQCMLCFLLANGAIVNARDDNDLTPLILCGCQTDKIFVQELLKYGANINDETSEGLNALTMAITNGNYNIADELLERGAYFHQSNYMYLLRRLIGKEDIDRFLDKYKNIVLNFRNEEGQSLLHLAVIMENVHWVDRLLDQSDLLEAIDKEGHIAFFYAIHNRYYRITQIFQTKKMLKTVSFAELQKACEKGDTVYVVKLLQFCGEYACLQDKDRESPLQIAFNHGNHDTVRVILRNEVYWSSNACDKIVTAALNHAKIFELYNIILAKLPDELWSLHISTIPCLSREREETSQLNWISQAEDLDAWCRSTIFDRSIFQLEIWPLLFLRRDRNRIFENICTKRDKMHEYLNFLSGSDILGNTFLHYICLISHEHFIFEELLPIESDNRLVQDLVNRQNLAGCTQLQELFNRQNLAGCTPLHYAAHSCKTMTHLFALGVDIRTKDKSGNDAYHYAYGHVPPYL